jgi:uncharacterized membrane protein
VLPFASKEHPGLRSLHFRTFVMLVSIAKVGAISGMLGFSLSRSQLGQCAA